MKTLVFAAILFSLAIQTGCQMSNSYRRLVMKERRLKKKLPQVDCSAFRAHFSKEDSENWKKDSLGSLGLRQQIFRKNPSLFIELSFAGMSQACMEELLGKEAKSHETAEKFEFIHYFPISTNEQDSLMTLMLTVDIKQGKIIESELRINTHDFPKGLVRGIHDSCNLADSVKYKINKEPAFLEQPKGPFHYLFALRKENPDVNDYLMGRHIDCIESRIGKANHYVRSYSNGFRGIDSSFSATYYGTSELERFQVSYSYPDLLITYHHYSVVRY